MQSKGKTGPKVSRFLRTRAFQRAWKKLPNYIKTDFKNLTLEMKAGVYPNGRKLKGRKGTKKGAPKEWQVRLSQSHRMTFNFKDGLATLLLIGEHKNFD